MNFISSVEEIIRCTRPNSEAFFVDSRFLTHILQITLVVCSPRYFHDELYASYKCANADLPSNNVVLSRFGMSELE